jgi:hypothetical protein
MKRSPSTCAALVSFASLVALASTARADDTFAFGTGRDGPLVVDAPATIVNLYASLATPVNAGDSTIALANASGFYAGDLVLLWQTGGLDAASATDDPIAPGATSAGAWELARVTSRDGSVLSLAAPIASAGGFAVASSQLVRVVEATDVTIGSSASLTAETWNGSVGGVVAILATGTVSGDGAIDVGGVGFRGGRAANNTGFFGCGLTAPTEGSPFTGQAMKGEGLALTLYFKTDGGQGWAANGGGGGICHNGGGAGGGNGGQGGEGGLGWPGTRDFGGSRAVGGHGGRPVVTTLDQSLPMGGGGGAGDENNGLGSDGARGGGAIFLRAESIDHATLRADGADAAAAQSATESDGAGGGGAGGSILVRASTLTGCPTISAIGGAGGAAGDDSGEADGTGGGGAGGHVRFELPSGVGATCTADVSAGLAGTQSNAAWSGGLHRAATPTNPADPLSIGVIERAAFAPVVPSVVDAGAESGADSGVDSGRDSGVESAVDAGAERGVDASIDAAPEATMDPPSDAGVGSDADASVATEAGASASDSGAGSDGAPQGDPRLDAGVDAATTDAASDAASESGTVADADRYVAGAGFQCDAHATNSRAKSPFAGLLLLLAAARFARRRS